MTLPGEMDISSLWKYISISVKLIVPIKLSLDISAVFYFISEPVWHSVDSWLSKCRLHDAKNDGDLFEICFLLMFFKNFLKCECLVTVPGRKQIHPVFGEEKTKKT